MKKRCVAGSVVFEECMIGRFFWGGTEPDETSGQCTSQKNEEP